MNLTTICFDLYDSGDLTIDGAKRPHLTDAAVTLIAEHCADNGYPLGDCASRIERNLAGTTAFAILLENHKHQEAATS